MAAAPEDNTGSLKEQIAKVFEVSLKVTVSDEPEAYGRLFQKGSWYADLKNNRLTNYTFNFDQMLNDKAEILQHIYLLYAHARICSIIRKSGKDIEELKRERQILLQKDEERKLGLHLLQFAEAVEEACTNLLPNVLCEYLYDLYDKFLLRVPGCWVCCG